MQTGYPCPYCGFTDHPENANYCGKCGKSIKFMSLYGNRESQLLDLSSLNSADVEYLQAWNDWMLDIENESKKRLYIDKRKMVNVCVEGYLKYIDRYNIDVISFERNCAVFSTIEKIKGIVISEIHQSRKLFGGKSKSELLKELKDILHLNWMD